MHESIHCSIFFLFVLTQLSFLENIHFFIRSDLADFEWDDEDEDKKPKKNPFDFGESDVSFDTSAFELSKKEIKEFLNTSRGITYTDDNDDSLGEPWGGAQYSLKTGKNIFYVNKMTNFVQGLLGTCTK